MFERFTEKAIKVIMLAQEEARRLGHNFVGTEQILLGLIGEGTGVAAKVLKSMGVNLKDARVEVEKIIGRGSGFVAVEIPFTPRAKRVLELSLEEARQLGHNYIGTEHLLLGLIREGEGVAARVLENLGVDLAKVRTGRAHTGILDHVMVDYYGTPTNITQVANVTLVDARTIGVQPWEKKMLGTIEKAIRDSNLGLNPSTQGEMIRVPTPALTEERRKEMVKLVKSEAEDAKIAVRNIRRDANEVLKKLLKDKAISEDDERRAQDEVQKLTDKFVTEIDKMVIEKEKEVLTV